MPTVAENLATIKTTAITRIIAIQAEIAEGDVRKPTYEVEGRKVFWAEHRKALIEEMRAMQEQVQWAKDQAAFEAGPVEFQAVGYT
jgi:hypothetical protein